MPAWFQTAVFYEVPVYAFADGDGDGCGDFAGLTERLDYLAWLGVDCIWVLPFFQSPLKDGGYDVSDFYQVLPRYGTIADVQRFLDEAHARGMRVISDMIMNHTSDQHRWFQDALKPGSPKRDWYVWSDDPAKYAEARIIFLDSEPSNWTWNEKAGAYYWHRFYHHQPDLNFDNSDVRARMIDVVRYWLGLGFDGLRLDAVPYLYERDGTDGENLPETHDFLKQLRQMVDAEFPGRVLLAEANQWPQEVVQYFGNGDECHMCFHFPVMPRLYMALARQDATSVRDILALTPPIPEGCQWGVFLRNHDELTLEMVTPEERDFMWDRYAPDPRMKLNLGIRRRLAPLVDGDRARIELLHGLLLSLPGSPVMYYGDEIGMGDAYLLPDRDGVRTPMQWEGGLTAGFSAANPGGLYLPLVTADGYRPDQVNVAAQQEEPGSLLHWVRDLLAVRKTRPAFGTGAFAQVDTSDPAVLAYTRAGDDPLLVAANFAATPRRAELDLSGYAGLRPVDLRSGAQLSAVEEGPYPLDLDSHGFLWLELLPA